jgi:hypothetical protein
MLDQIELNVLFYFTHKSIINNISDISGINKKRIVTYLLGGRPFKGCQACAWYPLNASDLPDVFL